MKKYCLTQCFKRKMSEMGVGILTALAVVAVILVAVIAFSAVFAGIGYVWFTLMGMPVINPAEAGMMIIIVMTVMTGITYFGAKFLAKIVTGTTNFVVRKYEGEPFQCSIFEECTEDSDESNIGGLR